MGHAIPQSDGAGPATEPWWGELHVPLGGVGRWQLGPLCLWLEHRPREWRISTVPGRDPAQDEVRVRLPAADDDRPPPTADVMRIGMDAEDESIVLDLRLADRPVVVKPVVPFHLPAHRSVAMFVTTPLWLRFALSAGAEALFELPTFRPSDTWFGPNTRRGDLCYSSRTKAHLNLDDVDPRRTRAMTCAQIRNETGAALRIDALKLPIPFARLHLDRRGRFWTDDVEVVRAATAEQSAVRLVEGAPAHADGPVRELGAPRLVPDRNRFVRAFEALVG